MRIAVIGSRSLWDIDTQTKIMNVMNGYLKDITMFVSGGCKGPDKIGEHWARQNDIPCTIYKPDWSLGKHAGMLRNTSIIENSDLILAFWDGESKGTQDSIKKAQKLSKKVITYKM